MNYLKYKRAVGITLVTTIALIIACILLAALGSAPAWNVSAGDMFKTTLVEIGNSFNVTLWGTAGYPTLGSVVTVVLVASVLIIIIGWLFWAGKTKRYISFAYIGLLILTTLCVLHYSENFVVYFEAELNSANILGIIVTCVTGLLIISMFLLQLFGILFDYFYLYTGEVLDDEPVEVIEDNIVIHEENHVVKTIEEVVIHKTIVHEQIVEETADVSIIEYVGEDETDEEPKEIGVRAPRVPFALKLKRGAPELREAYNELKAYIISYGLHSRLSISSDTFRKHTITHIKIQVSGKALRLNFALDPANYKDSTIPVVDSSTQKAYSAIPLTFRVKSPLSVRRAKLLIDDIASKNGFEKNKVEVQVDYARQALEQSRGTEYHKTHFGK